VQNNRKRYLKVLLRKIDLEEKNFRVKLIACQDQREDLLDAQKQHKGQIQLINQSINRPFMSWANSQTNVGIDRLSRVYVFSSSTNFLLINKQHKLQQVGEKVDKVDMEISAIKKQMILLKRRKNNVNESLSLVSQQFF
jgi:hypothetical protein